MSERSDAAEVIEFRADDGVLARASKMFAALGFANDRFGMAARLAGYLATYQELDAAAARLEGIKNAE